MSIKLWPVQEPKNQGCHNDDDDNGQSDEKPDLLLMCRKIPFGKHVVSL
jgi:hypothetical protein